MDSGKGVSFGGSATKAEVKRWSGEQRPREGVCLA